MMQGANGLSDAGEANRIALRRGEGSRGKVPKLSIDAYLSGRMSIEMLNGMQLKRLLREAIRRLSEQKNVK